MADELDPIVQKFDAEMQPYVDEMKRGEDEARQFARDNDLSDAAVRELIAAVRENTEAMRGLRDGSAEAGHELGVLRDHAEEAGTALGHVRDESLEASEAEKKLRDSSAETAASLDLMQLSGASSFTSLAPMVGLIGGLVVAIAGVAPAVASMGLGFGAFGAFAIPTLMQVAQGMQGVSAQQAILNSATATGAQKAKALANEQKIWASMPAPIADVVRQVYALEASWKQLSAAFEPQVLHAVDTALGIAGSLMKEIVPLAQQGAIAVNGFLSQIKAGIESSGFKQFLAIMTQMVVPATNAIAHLAFVILGVLGQALEQLAPLSVPFINILSVLIGALGGPVVAALHLVISLFVGLMTALDPLIVGLSKIATVLINQVSGSFSQFIPIIQQIVTILGGALLQILTDLEPLLANALTPNSLFMVALKTLPELLRMILPLFTWLASLLSHPIFAKLAVDIVTVIIALKGIIGVLGLVSRAFALMGIAIEATPIGWIITAVALVALGFYELWTHCAAFREFWEGLWRGVRAAMEPVVSWIRNVLNDMGRWWHDHGNQVMTVLKVLWAFIAATFKTGFAQLMSFVKPGLTEIADLFKAAWVIVSTVTTVAFEVIHTVVYVAMHTLYDVISLIMNLVEGHWGAAWHNLTDIASTQLHGIENIIRSITSGFFRILFNAGADIIRGLIAGIMGSVGGLVSTVQGIGHMVSGAFSAVLHILSPSQVFAEHGMNVIRGLILGLNAGTPALQGTMNSIAALVASSGAGMRATPYGAYAASAAAPASAAATGVGGISGNLIVQVNGQTLFEVAKSELYAYNIRNSGQVTGVVKPQ